jgi:hypothetical protein
MNLWLNNDEPLYRMACKVIRMATDEGKAGQALEAFVKDLQSHTTESFHSMWEEIGDLDNVDWSYLGNDWFEEMNGEDNE